MRGKANIPVLAVVLTWRTAAVEYENCTGTLSYIGDGFCDPENNDFFCDYDGGDCCECTCEDSTYTCGSNGGFNCKDDACLDPLIVAAYPNCTGDLLWMGDGFCDTVNNNVQCGYDLGDCCLCSCVEQGSCQLRALDCIDPDAGNPLYDCVAQLAPPPTCLWYVQRTWVVENTSQAQALAEAIYCSGGTFDVEWVGDIAMNSTIYVVDGTVLRVSGVGSDARISGNAEIRAFSVMNATLHLSYLTLDAGFSIAGGAIAASASNITLNQTTFNGNEAVGIGGAIYVDLGSRLALGGGASHFAQNTAGGDGGALYVSGGSLVSVDGGTTSFFNNTAGEEAGAFCIMEDSRVLISGDTVFLGNIASGGRGGAIYVVRASSLTSSGETSFFENTAGLVGGAMMIGNNSRAALNGTSTFVRNNAGYAGGAVYAIANATFSLDGQSTCEINRARGGGCISVHVSSGVYLTGEILLTDNSAEFVGTGGAAVIDGDSELIVRGEVTFSGNVAGAGGAVALLRDSRATFDGFTSFNDNRISTDASNSSDTAMNTSVGMGGALYVSEAVVSFAGSTTFVSNRAIVFGGAVLANLASVSWSGETAFLNNTVTHGGGAVAAFNSSVWWVGETEFTNNKAIDVDTDGIDSDAFCGGALLANASRVWWGYRPTANVTLNQPFNDSTLSSASTTSFVHNAALSGGALCAGDQSDLSWSEALTSFENNTAEFYGGAVFSTQASSLSWSAPTSFSHNSALSFGGALALLDSSSTSWSANTTYFNNSATVSGGGVLLMSKSNISWTGRTTFVANAAEREGGAIVVFSPDDQDATSVAIDGPTTFVSNRGGSNGGGLAIIGAMFLRLNASDVIFRGNSAGVTGGALFVSGASVGPNFNGVTFTANSAQLGGAVYVASSGDAKINLLGLETENPTRFISCTFIGNEASAVGGAVQSAAGQDEFQNTSFVGNIAGVGGALRLAGTASLSNCSFTDNISNEGEGPAVSNIGYISSLTYAHFGGNTFSCPRDMYLEFVKVEKTNEIYAAICDGCEAPCQGCSFENETLAPSCVASMTHSTSPGNTTTLEMISIDPGYWRATSTSREVLECYNGDACLGGVTGVNECRAGYRGPYCAICTDGYTPSLGYVCAKCSDRASGIFVATVAVILFVSIVIATTLFLISGEQDNFKWAPVRRLLKYIPFQSLKIVIVAWQILTQFASVANVTYPNVYQRFLDGVNFLNFNLSWVFSFGCMIDFDFHQRLLSATMGPLIVIAYLGVTYAVAARRNRGSEDALRYVRHKHLSLVLLVTFLVYSSVSALCFQVFACDDLEDNNTYLRADFRIQCDSSKHEAFKIYAGLMIFLYVLGIPAFYAGLLYRNRDALLRDERQRANNPELRLTSTLWKPYKPSRYYYEVLECGRRLLLAGVVVFIYPNTAAQIAVALVLAFAFALVSEGLAPYASSWDMWISRVGHVVVFVSVYVGLLLKVDVSEERSHSQKTFEVILVFAHGSMIAAVLSESIVVMCSLRTNQEEDPAPRFRRTKWMGRSKDSSLHEAEVDFGRVQPRDAEPVA